MGDPVSRNAPCPCGSGKKYKHCCVGKTRHAAGAPASKRVLVVVSLLVVAGLGAFAWMQNRAKPATASTPAPTTTASPSSAGDFQLPFFGQPAASPPPVTDGLVDVDMGALSAEQKARAMQVANTDKCDCGCGETVAQCINFDPSCPLRPGLVQRMKGLVTQLQSATTTQ